LPSTGRRLSGSGNSRLFGVILIATGGVLFALAFETGLAVFEFGSLIAFILGVILVAVEIEPRVKLQVASDSILGYLEALVGTLRMLVTEGAATYVPDGNNVRMTFTRNSKPAQIDLAPVGDGLYSELVEESGQMGRKGFDYFSSWLPRLLVDGLGASDGVTVAKEGDRVTVAMKRPFVRPLCVNPFVNANVCCRMGCPLAGAVAQSLAAATGRNVKFDNCAYDPKLQVATTSLDMGRSP
jgi:hypothetical protein